MARNDTVAGFYLGDRMRNRRQDKDEPATMRKGERADDGCLCAALQNCNCTSMHIADEPQSFLLQALRAQGVLFVSNRRGVV